MFPLKSIWPTKRIDFILPRSCKVNIKCLRTFQIIVWLLSQLSQNPPGIASHQLQGWEGINLQLRQQGLCQQGPLHTVQSQQHPRQGRSSLHRCLCFPLTDTGPRCWMYGTSLPYPGCCPCAVQPLLSTAQASFSPSDLLDCPADPTAPSREPDPGCHPNPRSILLHLGLGDPWQVKAALPRAKLIWSLLNSGAHCPLGERKPADASSCLLLSSLTSHLCPWDTLAVISYQQM